MFRIFSSIFLAVSFVLAGCQSNHQGTDQAVGTLGGAAAGGLVGSQIGKGGGNSATVGLGILLGAWAGNDISAALDENDRLKDRQAENRATIAPIGQQITWSNPDSGHAGTLIPVHDGYDNSGVYCRQFQQTVIISGKQQQGQIRACQQPDGSWKAVP